MVTRNTPETPEKTTSSASTFRGILKNLFLPVAGLLVVGVIVVLYLQKEEQFQAQSVSKPASTYRLNSEDTSFNEDINTNKNNELNNINMHNKHINQQDMPQKNENDTNVVLTEEQLKQNISQLTGQLFSLLQNTLAESGMPSSTSSSNTKTVVAEEGLGQLAAHGTFGVLLQITTNRYQQGGPQIKNLTDLRNLAVALHSDTSLITAIDSLIALTPEEDPVTLAELEFYLQSLHEQGAPKPVEASVVGASSEQQATLEQPLSWRQRVARWFKSLVRVEKLPDASLMAAWQQQLAELRLLVAQGQIDKAAAMFASSGVLQSDVRLRSFAEHLGRYVAQQQQLHELNRHYIKTSLEMVK